MRQFKWWALLIVCNAIFSVFDFLIVLPAAHAGCLEDTRRVQLSQDHVQLRTFLCGPDDNPQSPPVLRVEFHRLSDVAASTLVAGAKIQFVNETLGDVKVLKNDVYETFHQLVQRFGTERDGRNSWGENGGIHFSIETPRGGTGASPAIDQRIIAYSLEFGYSPALRDVINPQQLTQRWKHYYRRSNTSGAVGTQNLSGQLSLWRYATENDFRGYKPDNAYASGAVKLSQFLLSQGCPRELFVIQAGIGESCEIDYVASWGLSLARIEPIVDFAIIKNVGGTEVALKQLYGAPPNSNLCRKRGAWIDQTKSATTNLLSQSLRLAAGESVLVPLKVSLVGPQEGVFVKDDDIEASRIFGRIKSSEPGTVFDFGGGLRLAREQLLPPQKPGIAEYIYGPEWNISAIDTGDGRITLAKKSSNFLNVTITSGGASCPYLLAWNPATDRWSEYGKVLHVARSKDTEQAHTTHISGFRAKFRLEEREPEVAYIDHAELNVELSDGRTLTEIASEPRLAVRDGQYAVLRMGEAVDFEFKLPDGVKEDDVHESRLTVFGYYEPNASQASK